MVTNTVPLQQRFNRALAAHLHSGMRLHCCGLYNLLPTSLPGTQVINKTAEAASCHMSCHVVVRGGHVKHRPEVLTALCVHSWLYHNSGCEDPPTQPGTSATE
eukprot:scaffold73026_cov24-Tisochrysis_lutea.AAC.3